MRVMHKAKFWLMGTILVALVLMLGGGPAVSKQEAVVGQESLTKAQEASKLVYKLDSTMMADYAATQRLVGESQSPVILAMFNGVGGKYILRRNGKVTDVEPVPILYRQLKSISHTIVGVFEIVSPYFKNPQTPDWKPKLTQFNQMLKEALKNLSKTGMPPDVEKRCRKILAAGVKFTGTALKKGTFTSKGYSAYAKSVWPEIAKNVDLAGKLQVDHFEKVLIKWRKQMGEKEWSRLYAVVNTAWAMRRENVHFQILAQMMGRQAVNDHLIIAESIKDPTPDDLIMLLGRIINDRDLAVHVFGRNLKYRMDVELMGNATRREIQKRAWPHHPALDLKWLKYKEHKMPNE